MDYAPGNNQTGVNYVGGQWGGLSAYYKTNYSGDPSNGAVAVAPSGYSVDNNIYGIEEVRTVVPGKITRVHGTSLAWS